MVEGRADLKDAMHHLLLPSSAIVAIAIAIAIGQRVTDD